jgi:hypothetical protein
MFGYKPTPAAGVIGTPSRVVRGSMYAHSAGVCIRRCAYIEVCRDIEAYPRGVASRTRTPEFWIALCRREIVSES